MSKSSLTDSLPSDATPPQPTASSISEKVRERSAHFQERPATVADVQRIVAEAQKETERGFERVLKVMSEQLIAFSAEHQAPVLGHRKFMMEMSRRQAAAQARGLKRNDTVVSTLSSDEPHPIVSDYSMAPTELSIWEDDGAEGGDTPRTGSKSASPRRMSWTEETEETGETGENGLAVQKGNSWDIARSLGFGDFEVKVKRSRTPITSHATQRMKQERNFIQNVVKSHWFENMSGIVILLNAVVIGFHANRRAMSEGRFCEKWWLDLFLAFNVFFTLEVMIRIYAAGLDFIFGLEWRLNLFDLTIVVAGVVEEVIQRNNLDEEDCNTMNDGGGGLTAVRVIRVLRVVRMTRTFRSMAMFRDFRVMASSILRCLIPLFWACILLILVQWVFGVYFVHYVSDLVQDELKDELTRNDNGTRRLDELAMNETGTNRTGSMDIEDVLTRLMFKLKECDESKDENDLEKMKLHFGNLWRAMYTLFRSVTGGMDWHDAVKPFMDKGWYPPMLMYIFFIALTTFAVLNVVTGVFVENATKLAMHDRDDIIQDKLERRESYKKDALAVFKEADSDGSGMVSYSEFEALVLDPRMQAFFSCLELDFVEARRLFRLMDSDGNGQISPQEFVTGCMCLKGSAKTMDVAALLLEVRRISELWSKHMDHLDEEFEQIVEGMNRDAFCV